MVQHSVEIHASSFGQDQARSSRVAVLSPKVESTGVFPKVAAVDEERPSHTRKGTHVPQSRREKTAAND